MISDFHLFLNQVLCLDEGADKLLSLFLFQVTNFILVNNIGDFKLLFFRL